MAKFKIGRVLKKNGPTLKIEVFASKIHPIYQKRYKVKKHYLVHDEREIVKLGDLIEIEETRPLSRRKCFKVKGIVKKKNDSN